MGEVGGRNWDLAVGDGGETVRRGKWMRWWFSKWRRSGEIETVVRREVTLKKM